MAGSGLEFVDRGSHELKGVPASGACTRSRPEKSGSASRTRHDDVNPSWPRVGRQGHERNRTHASLLALAAAVILVLGACGGGDGNGAEGSAPDDSTATTVSVDTVDGVGEVLVDSEGAALYAADQESDGTVLCVDACTDVWVPLTVDDGMPTGSDGLGDSLGVVPRPDGTRQVTFDGRLLYSFVEDSEPGTVTGNGSSDSFGEQAFTWHVATPTGVSTSSANSTPSTGGYGGGYGR